MKHKPTPWGFGDRESNCICTNNGRGSVIHRPSALPQFNRSDLAYIIQCVNSHEDMLYALERTRALLKDNPHVRVQSNEIGNDLAVQLLFERIDKAIAKAKGSD